VLESSNCSDLAEAPRAWLLDRIVDRFGNAVDIDYLSGEPLLPADIRYTSGGSSPPLKHVHFGYDNTRPDARAISLAGVPYSMTRMSFLIRQVSATLLLPT